MVVICHLICRNVNILLPSQISYLGSIYRGLCIWLILCTAVVIMPFPRTHNQNVRGQRETSEPYREGGEPSVGFSRLWVAFAAQLAPGRGEEREAAEPHGVSPLPTGFSTLSRSLLLLGLCLAAEDRGRQLISTGEVSPATELSFESGGLLPQPG